MSVRAYCYVCVFACVAREQLHGDCCGTVILGTEETISSLKLLRALSSLHGLRLSLSRETI